MKRKITMQNEDEQNTQFPLNFLSKISEQWANDIDLEHIAQKISENQKAIEDMICNAFEEGFYRGFKQHKEYWRFTKEKKVIEDGWVKIDHSKTPEVNGLYEDHEVEIYCSNDDRKIAALMDSGEGLLWCTYGDWLECNWEDVTHYREIAPPPKGEK